MSPAKIILLATLVLAIAQNITTSLYVPGVSTNSIGFTSVPTLGASIVGSDATATTYAIENEDGTPFITLTEGPATAAYSTIVNAGANQTFTGALECSVASTISAVCLSYCIGACDKSLTSTMTYSSLDQSYVPVSITVGGTGTGTGNSTTNTGGVSVITAATTTNTAMLPSSTGVTVVSTEPATASAVTTIVITGVPTTGTASGTSCIGSHTTGFWTCSTAGGSSITANRGWDLNRGWALRWALGPVVAFAMM